MRPRGRYGALPIWGSPLSPATRRRSRPACTHPLPACPTPSAASQAGGDAIEAEHQIDVVLRLQRLFAKGLLAHAHTPRPIESDFPYVVLGLHVLAAASTNSMQVFSHK